MHNTHHDRDRDPRDGKAENTTVEMNNLNRDRRATEER